MAKLIHKPLYLSLSEAALRFRTESGLLAALSEGHLAARGRLTTDFTAGAEGQFGTTAEPFYGEPTIVPVSAWRDMTVSVERNQLQHDQTYAAYASIEILEADLEAAFGAGRIAGGRPAEHDWELILKQAMVWISQNPIAKETTLAGWINELAVNLPYCVANDVPKEDALQDHFRDVYHAIVKGKPLPVGKPKRSRR